MTRLKQLHSSFRWTIKTSEILNKLYSTFRWCTKTSEVLNKLYSTFRCYTKTSEVLNKLYSTFRWSTKTSDVLNKQDLNNYIVLEDGTHNAKIITGMEFKARPVTQGEPIDCRANTIRQAVHPAGDLHKFARRVNYFYSSPCTMSL